MITRNDKLKEWVKEMKRLTHSIAADIENNAVNPNDCNMNIEKAKRYLEWIKNEIGFDMFQKGFNDYSDGRKKEWPNNEDYMEGFNTAYEDTLDIVKYQEAQEQKLVKTTGY